MADIPAGMKEVDTGTGYMMQVPEDWDQAAIDREIRNFQTYKQQQQEAPSDIPQVEPFLYRSHTAADDPWYMRWGVNPVLAAARGTGQAIATVGDIFSNARPSAIKDDLRYFSDTNTLPDFVRPEGDYSSVNTAPVSDLYNAAIPQMPKGYETYETAGEIAGPALIEAALTGKVRGIPYRVARDVGLGVGGGYLGGEIAARTAGEKYRDLGSLLGGAVIAAGGGRLLRGATSKRFSEAGGETTRRLETIDRTNAALQASGREEQIPPSVGLIGNQRAAALEDATGRTIFSNRASDVRRQQVTGMEAALEDALQKARGGPSTGAITPETIGREAETALDTTEGKIGNEVQRIQNKLESDVGSHSPVNLQNAVDALDEIIQNRKGKGADLINQAQDLKARILEDLIPTSRHPLPPYTGPRPTVRPKQVTAGTAGYGAVKDTRSRLGRQLDRNQKPLEKAVQKQAYGGMTQDMREAAAMQGVDPAHFDVAQAETARLLNQADELPGLRGNTEGQTYSKTIGAKGTSHLQPLFEHTPDEALKMLVDDLEMKTRKGNAGGPPNPQNFDVRALEQWRTLDPERKRRITGGRADIEQQIDDAADLARVEANRAGKRTRPFGNNTMGVTANYAIPAGFAALKAPALTVASLFGPAAIAKTFTSPGFARMVANPALTIPEYMGRAVAGATSGTSPWVRATPEQRQQEAQQAEEEQRLRDVLNQQRGQ